MQPESAHYATLSTAALPPRDRLAILREEIGMRAMQVDLEPACQGPIDVQLSWIDFGRVQLTSGRYSPIVLQRTPQVIARGDDRFLFGLNYAGSQHERLRDIQLNPGDACMLDAVQPYKIAIGPNCLSNALMVSRSSLLARLPDAEDWIGRKIDPKLEALGLINAYLSVVMKQRPQTEAALQAIGAHLLDLIVLAFATPAEAAREHQTGGVAKARFAALCATITRKLRAPGLSLATLAREHRLSERYIQKLFEVHGENFTSHVRNERLALIHAHLSNPRFRNHKIANIALAAGFGDVSYFNRCFRRRYGQSPSSVRATALNGAH